MNKQLLWFIDDAITLVHDAEGGIVYHPARLPPATADQWLATLRALVSWRSLRRPMYERVVDAAPGGQRWRCAIPRRPACIDAALALVQAVAPAPYARGPEPVPRRARQRGAARRPRQAELVPGWPIAIISAGRAARYAGARPCRRQRAACHAGAGQRAGDEPRQPAHARAQHSQRARRRSRASAWRSGQAVDAVAMARMCASMAAAVASGAPSGSGACPRSWSRGPAPLRRWRPARRPGAFPSDSMPPTKATGHCSGCLRGSGPRLCGRVCRCATRLRGRRPVARCRRRRWCRGPRSREAPGVPGGKPFLPKVLVQRPAGRPTHCAPPAPPQASDRRRISWVRLTCARRGAPAAEIGESRSPAARASLAGRHPAQDAAQRMATSQTASPPIPCPLRGERASWLHQVGPVVGDGVFQVVAVFLDRDS